MSAPCTKPTQANRMNPVVADASSQSSMIEKKSHMTFLSCGSSSESNDVEFAHTQTPPAPPTTPQHQPTKPASTNAPVRPPKLTIEPPKIKCNGCIEDQPNQMAHVHVGGCLEEAFNLVADDNTTEEITKACPTCYITGCKGECEKEPEYNNTYKCPCYVEECPGDCGTLWCGCIDVCRGRCGLQDPRGHW
jgi:hypothetical protein